MCRVPFPFCQEAAFTRKKKKFRTSTELGIGRTIQYQKVPLQFKCALFVVLKTPSFLSQMLERVCLMPGEIPRASALGQVDWIWDLIWGPVASDSPFPAREKDALPICAKYSQIHTLTISKYLLSVFKYV